MAPVAALKSVLDGVQIIDASHCLQINEASGFVDFLVVPWQ